MEEDEEEEEDGAGAGAGEGVAGVTAMNGWLCGWNREGSSFLLKQSTQKSKSGHTLQ